MHVTIQPARNCNRLPCPSSWEQHNFRGFLEQDNLRLIIYRSESVRQWPQAARQVTASAHLIRRITKHCGGARSEVDRRLVKCHSASGNISSAVPSSHIISVEVSRDHQQRRHSRFYWRAPSAFKAHALKHTTNPLQEKAPRSSPYVGTPPPP